MGKLGLELEVQVSFTVLNLQMTFSLWSLTNRYIPFNWLNHIAIMWSHPIDGTSQLEDFPVKMILNFKIYKLYVRWVSQPIHPEFKVGPKEQSTTPGCLVLGCCTFATARYAYVVVAVAFWKVLQSWICLCRYISRALSLGLDMTCSVFWLSLLFLFDLLLLKRDVGTGMYWYWY